MNTKATKFRIARRSARVKRAAILGNCPMCGHCGKLSQPCLNECSDWDDLANEETGLAEANDLAGGQNLPCKYKVAVMPNGVTTIRAKWYQGAIVDGDVQGLSGPYGGEIQPGMPYFVLEDNCIHHRTILAMKEVQRMAAEEARSSGSRLLVEDV
jgi:hypothetical protein